MASPGSPRPATGRHNNILSYGQGLRQGTGQEHFRQRRNLPLIPPQSPVHNDWDKIPENQWYVYAKAASEMVPEWKSPLGTLVQMYLKPVLTYVPIVREFHSLGGVSSRMASFAWQVSHGKLLTLAVRRPETASVELPMLYIPKV